MVKTHAPNFVIGMERKLAEQQRQIRRQRATIADLRAVLAAVLPRYRHLYERRAAEIPFAGESHGVAAMEIAIALADSEEPDRARRAALAASLRALG